MDLTEFVIKPFQTVEKPNFSILKLTCETKVPFTVHMSQKGIMCYILRPPLVGTTTGLPLPLTGPVSALSLLTDYASSNSTDSTPKKTAAAETTTPSTGTLPENPINVDQTDIDQPPLTLNVTPTRQQPLQIDLDRAVDLPNQLTDICETLLPGHGQFLVHIIYLYFLQHITLP